MFEYRTLLLTLLKHVTFLDQKRREEKRREEKRREEKRREEKRRELRSSGLLHTE